MINQGYGIEIISHSTCICELHQAGKSVAQNVQLSHSTCICELHRNWNVSSLK